MYERRSNRMPNDIITRRNIKLSICGISEQYYNNQTTPIIAHEYGYNVVEVTHIMKRCNNNMLNIKLVDQNESTRFVFNAIQYLHSISKLYSDNEDLQMIYVPSDSNKSLLAEIVYAGFEQNLTAEMCTIDNINKSIEFIKCYLYDQLQLICDEASSLDKDVIIETVTSIFDNVLDYLMDYINMYINTYANNPQFNTSISDFIVYIRNMASQSTKLFNISDVLKKYRQAASIVQIPSSTLFNYFHLTRLLTNDIYYSTNMSNEFIGFKRHQSFPGLTRIMPKFNISIDILNGYDNDKWKTMIFDYGEGRQVIQIVNK